MRAIRVLNAIRSFSAVSCGYRLEDKMLIFLNRILHLSHPLNRSYILKYGKSLIVPSRLVNNFYCRNYYGIFKCPGGSSELQFQQIYEPTVKEEMIRLRKGVFVDIGASIGLYTVMMSKLLEDKGQVISLEPHPTRFAALTENIKINKCNNVTAINVAGWSKSDELRLYEHVFGGGSLDHSLMANSGRYVVVKAKRLDDILKELNINKIGLIKIDVEGAEVNVLQGMKETLMKNTAQKIIFEAIKPENLTRACEILRHFNYVTSPLDDGIHLAEYKSDSLSVSSCEER